MSNTSCGVGRLLAVLCLSLAGCASQPKLAEPGAAAPTRSIFALVEQADLAYEQARWLEAGQLYQAVTKAVPDDHYAWFRLGNSYLYRGQLDAAIFQYQEALKRNGQHAKTHFNLSIAHTMQALAALDAAAASLRPGDAGQSLARERMAGLRAVLGDTQPDASVRPTDEPPGYFEERHSSR